MEAPIGVKPSVLFEFEVEKVIGISSDGRYQVQWAPAWVSKFHLVGCQHLIEQFQKERLPEKENIVQDNQYGDSNDERNVMDGSCHEKDFGTAEQESSCQIPFTQSAIKIEVEEERDVVKHRDTVFENLPESNECDNKSLRFIRIMQGLMNSAMTDNEPEHHQLPIHSKISSTSGDRVVPCQGKAELQENSSPATNAILPCISQELPIANSLSVPNEQQLDSGLGLKNNTKTELIQTYPCNAPCQGEGWLLGNSSISTDESLGHKSTIVSDLPKQKETMAEHLQGDAFKEHACPHCSKLFSQTGALIQNVNIQESLGLPSCHHCGKSITRKDVFEPTHASDIFSDNVCGEADDKEMDQNSLNYTDNKVSVSQMSTKDGDDKEIDHNSFDINDNEVPVSKRSAAEIERNTGMQLPVEVGIMTTVKNLFSSYNLRSTRARNMISKHKTLYSDEQKGDNKLFVQTNTKPIKEINTRSKNHKKNNLKKHIVNTRVKCHTSAFCSKKLAQKGNLKTSVKVPTNHQLFSCPCCDKVFCRENHLKRHVLTHTRERRFHCKACGKAFKKNCQMTQHFCTNNGEKPFTCGQCGKHFAQKIYLKKHEFTHTVQKPYSCPHCSQSLSSKHNLIKHMQKCAHLGKKPYLCEFCGNCFAWKWQLVEHTRNMHRGEQSFSCEMCGKSFANKKNLTQHIARHSHSGEKMFPCELCGISFAWKGHLVKHMQITHTGKKPFLCEKCGKSFACRHYLTRHKCIKAEVKSYGCEVCGKKFTNVSLKVEHRWEKHVLK